MLLDKWESGIGKTVPDKWCNLITETIESDKINIEEEVKDRIFSITITPVKEAGYANLYAHDITERLNLDAESTILFGHSFVKSLVLATEKHEPDAVLIGHTKDEGFWNRMRTRLAYRIMRKVNSAVIVFHMPKH